MNVYCRRVDPRFQKQGQELRQRFYELGERFVQLEHAFQINLQVQRRQRDERNLLKRKNQELQEVIGKCMKEKEALHRKLKRMVGEKNRWKKQLKRQKMNSETSRKNLEERSRNSLRSFQETHNQEIIRIQEEACQKYEKLERRIRDYEKSERRKNEYILEVVHLLENMKDSDGNSFVYRSVTKALQCLTVHENAFKESLESLKSTLPEENQKISSQYHSLQRQNDVLKEIIKGLKRKESAHPHVIKNGSKSVEEKTSDMAKPGINNDDTALNNGIDSTPVFLKNGSQNIDGLGEEITGCGCDKSWEKSRTGNSTECGNDFVGIETTASHLNGIPYTEYVIRFSKSQELKLKHKSGAISRGGVRTVLFVDDENEYFDAPLDDVYVFLRNLERRVQIKLHGVDCASQTTVLKFVSTFTQTLGSAKVPRGNFPNVMLNCEKRGIERELCKLEQRVEGLRTNALEQARSMIRNQRCQENIFKYVESLSQD